LRRSNICAAMTDRCRDGQMAHRSALWRGYWLACRIGTDRARKDSAASHLPHILANQYHGPKQTGGQQRRVRPVGLHIGKRQLRGSRLLVADQPIHPCVHYRDCDLVSPRPERGGHVHVVRRVPDLPSSLPLTVTTAKFFTSPRSIHNRAPLRNHSGEASTVFV